MFNRKDMDSADHAALHGMIQEMSRLRRSEKKCRSAIEGIMKALVSHSPFPLQAWHLMETREIAAAMQLMRVALGEKES